jgi:hypothetical protein
MKLLKLCALAAMVVLLTQCYPEGPDYIDQYDLVYSNYDPDYDFTARKTFAMPDKILKIDDDLINGTGINYVNIAYSSLMLAKIRQNMLDNGWNEVGIADRPDVLIAPSAFELTTYYYYDWGYYYDWWYGGYYPGGGWYYPYPVVEGYSTGSLVVAMVDPNDISANDKARVTWVFVINGLLEGSTSNFNARMTKGINQAFEQSQYLKK